MSEQCPFRFRVFGRLPEPRLSSHLPPTRPAVPAVSHARSLLHALSLWSSVGEAGRSISLPSRTVCSIFWLGLPLWPVGQRLLSLWADHLNVDSLGFASRSLQGSKGVHLSPISHQVCSCCGVALTAQVAFF